MNPTEYEFPFFVPSGVTVKSLEELNIDDRVRTDLGEEDGSLQELAESISNLGLIHPPTFTEDGELIAGGRRIAAMRLLGCTSVPFLTREKMPEHLVLELELEENLKRKGMKWQEKVLSLYKMHNARVVANAKMSKNWKQSETGKLLKVSTGHVSHALTVAKRILAGDEEVTNAENLVKALEIMLKRKETEAQEALARRNGIIEPITPAPMQVGTPAAPMVIDLGGSDVEVPEVEPEDRAKTQNPEVNVGEQQFNIDLGALCQHGDCIEIMSKMRSESVDHVVTDIPYGIDMKNLDQFNDIDLVEDTHDVEQNVEMMPKFLEAAYRVVKASGYVVFWYDLDHHEKLLKWAEEVGFSPQRWPLVWVKSHPCRNSAAQKNFTKAVETAMVLRKSTQSSLIKPATTNYVIASGTAERKLYDNPFSKPFDVWKFILDHIAFKGQTILDPYAGEMSCARACINVGMKPVSLEIDKVHFNKGVAMLKELWSEMFQNQVTFVNDPTVVE